MLHYASGAAFVDRNGTLVAADDGFLVALNLPAHDPTGALRTRAAESPALRMLLGGEGPEVARLGSKAEVELERHRSAVGLLLVVRTRELQDELEHAQRSNALSRVISGVAHDIKNPLNAMALQLAILSEKLVGAEAAAAGPHLGALREQVSRVNEVLRRFLDVADPPAPLGYTDLCGWLADASALFAHEARRRRLQFVVEPGRGNARSGGDPARVGRLVLVLLAGAVAATPDGGRIEVGLQAADGQAILRLAHALGDGESENGYDWEVDRAAARGLGGELDQQREEGVRHIVLRLPMNERT